MVPLETVKLSEVQQILADNYKWNYLKKPSEMIIEEGISANQRECIEEEFKMALMKQFRVEDLTQSVCERVSEA